MKKSILYLITICLMASCQSIDQPGLLVPKTVMEDSSLPAIEIDGIRLHAETFGNPTDPILIAIHGGPGGDYRGLLNFKDLANDGMFVVFYDQRGSGLSERLDNNHYESIQSFIDELDGVINYYKKDASQQVILAGHSWGAMLATAYINQNPENISGSILIEPGGFTWEQTEAYITRSKTLNLFSEATNDVVYQDQFITSSNHETLDYKLALTLSDGAQTGDATPAPFWRFGAVCNTNSIQLAMDNPELMDFTQNLNSFTREVLFVYSEFNMAYGLEHASLLSAAYPNANLIQINGCGHEIPEYGWQNLYPSIKTYLKNI